LRFAPDLALSDELLALVDGHLHRRFRDRAQLLGRRAGKQRDGCEVVEVVSPGDRKANIETDILAHRPHWLLLDRTDAPWSSVFRASPEPPSRASACSTAAPSTCTTR